VSRNFYSEIHLHVTWHTKQSAPLLTPDVESFVHRWLEKRIVNTQGAYVHEIGGTETHVHLAVTIQPTIVIADFIGQLKGASSHDTNQQFGLRGKVLQWQAGYGVVSFGTANMEWVRAYIRNQRSHHQRGTVQPRLERTADEVSSENEAQREAP
jgi:putative transposase